MKFLLSFLLKFLPFNCDFFSAKQIADILTNHVIEVEDFHSLWSLLDGYEVVKIINYTPHPKSERLKICEVLLSNKSVIQVVCGAPNVSIGMKSVLAPVGVYLPNSQNKIGQVKILGVDSSGMLCSEQELGISDLHESIISLPESASIGDHPGKYLINDDFIFQVNITPNMAYCLSIKNLAYELSSAIEIQNLFSDTQRVLERKVSDSNIDYSSEEFEGSFDSNFNITINSKNCEQFCIIEIQNIDNTVETPKDIKRILKFADIKSVSPVVDIVNYAMIVTGQPMHAYDAAKIFDREIYISNFCDLDKDIAQENFLALDKNTYNFYCESLVIHDKEKICCLAGIIGSNDTKCTPNTKNIILESAVFEKSNILKTGQITKINTQSRYRFERGIDSKVTKKALVFACKLICQICGGIGSKIQEKRSTISANSEKQISIFPQKLNKFLSINITNNQLISILQILKYQIIECILKTGEKIEFEDLKKDKNNHLQELIVIPPSHKKNFVNNTAELYGEIIRLYGYNNIKYKKNHLNRKEVTKLSNDFTEQYKDFKSLRISLSALGYNEVINWSFDSISEDEKKQSNIKIVNCISENMNYMRDTMLNCMLRAVDKNRAKLEKNISIFEIGANYKNIENEDFESFHIALMLSGNFNEKSVLNSERSFDIFDLKQGVEEVLFSILKIDDFIDKYCELSSANIDANIYHITRSSKIIYRGNLLGVFGEINPKYLNSFNINFNEPVYFAELNYEHIRKLKKESFISSHELNLSDFQPVIREFCFVIDKTVNISEVIEAIKNFNQSTEEKIIENIKATDIYENEKEFGPSKKSLTITISMQPRKKTLTTEELSIISNSIIEIVRNKLGGILRLGFNA